MLAVPNRNPRFDPIQTIDDVPSHGLRKIAREAIGAARAWYLKMHAA